MESKIMQVFYGNDCLPYKDKARSVHYPIIGQAFEGASATTEIRFYVEDIGGVDTTKWIANTKLPSGKKGYKLLDSAYDSVVQESYVVLQLDQFYTQEKGDVYISLNGYDGGITLEQDENDNYILEGTPIIQATGSIKITMQYAVQINQSDIQEYIALDDILAYITSKADVSFVKSNFIPKLYVDIEHDDYYDKAIQDYITPLVANGFNLNVNGSPLIIGLELIDSGEGTGATYIISFISKGDGANADIQLLRVSDKLYATFTEFDLNETFETLISGITTSNSSHLSTDIDIARLEGLIGANADDILDLQNNKQDTLIGTQTAGQNLKTVNGESLLGSGNLVIDAGRVDWGAITGNIQNQTDLMEKFNEQTYRDDELADRIESIEDLIPAQATQQNKLADKDFVNSSIATNTAYFKGTYNVVADLGLTIEATHEQIATALASEVSNPTNNDYVFVSFPDPTVPTEYNKFSRYKYNSDTGTWSFEFDLNNSSFTAQQWASINSGITAQMVADLPLKSANNTWGGQNTFSGIKIASNGNIGTVNDDGDLTITVGNDKALKPSWDSHYNLGSTAYKWKDLYLSGTAYIPTIHIENGTKALEITTDNYNCNFYTLVEGTLTNIWSFGSQALFPRSSNINLGTSSANNRWNIVYARDVDISGNLTDGTNSMSIADIANSNFNVINASDITNNTLTQEQYDLITNGKPTLIKGTYLGHKNMLITYWDEYVTTWRALAISEATVFSVMLNTTTKALTDGGNDIKLTDVTNINGKNLPSYPTTNTSPQVLTIGANGGNLSWENHMTEWYGTQAEYDALGTYDSNTIYNILES